MVKRLGMIFRKNGGWGKRKVLITESGALIRKRHPGKSKKRRM